MQIVSFGGLRSVLAMVFKLAERAGYKGKKPGSYQLNEKVFKGVNFINGIEKRLAAQDSIHIFWRFLIMRQRHWRIRSFKPTKACSKNKYIISNALITMYFNIHITALCVCRVAMVFKLSESARYKRKKPGVYHIIEKVIEGVSFINGIEEQISVQGSIQNFWRFLTMRQRRRKIRQHYQTKTADKSYQHIL
ncbi:MAG TPA: hypothetical protein VN367_02880 [Chlorobaculum sp.]|nr:hypothetical protein [Chlorobaculum sp.]